VHFVSRNTHNCLHVGFVELNNPIPRGNFSLSPESALTPGSLGHFDEPGAYPVSTGAREQELCVCYISWNPSARKPLLYDSLGAVLREDSVQSFQEVFRAPLSSHTEHDL